MRIILTGAAFILALFGLAVAGESQELKKNASVFEGTEFAYVIYPPTGFQVVTDEAIDAGFSMAYIPQGQHYGSASVVIDINIFRLKNGKANNGYLQELVADDIGRLRKHYGKGLTIRPVDSVYNANKLLMPTFYFNDTSRFIPTVMLSYFNGKSEIIIFQLSIGRLQPRFEAEEIYMDCIGAFKSLIKEDIEERSRRLKAGGK